MRGVEVSSYSRIYPWRHEGEQVVLLRTIKGIWWWNIDTHILTKSVHDFDNLFVPANMFTSFPLEWDVDTALAIVSPDLHVVEGL